ncbi:MAG: hypothetical protein KC766_18455 [Myxococcales bacterium]|nr:hypothetical protein [Myxococcales bacterium]
MLYQLADGRFQLISGGCTAVLMAGVDYVLVRHDLAEHLATLGVQGFQRHPAIIYRRSEDLEILTHDCLIVEAHYDLKDLENPPLDGLRVFMVNGRMLFVTPKLRELLLDSRFRHELSFAYGRFGIA